MYIVSAAYLLQGSAYPLQDRDRRVVSPCYRGARHGGAAGEGDRTGRGGSCAGPAPGARLGRVREPATPYPRMGSLAGLAVVVAPLAIFATRPALTRTIPFTYAFGDHGPGHYVNAPAPAGGHERVPGRGLRRRQVLSR